MGDIGCVDEDGFITLMGRSKDMIISGGFNIYPRDLEEVLLRQPGVADAAVIGVPSRQWGETPLGFVVISKGALVDLNALLEQANAELGKTIEELPRSHIGKILKTELREMAENQ
jgi:acyl-CoA synthetase (AMP-forming)/AMP-acid ligase II